MNAKGCGRGERECMSTCILFYFARQHAIIIVPLHAECLAYELLRIRNATIKQRSKAKAKGKLFSGVKVGNGNCSLNEVKATMETVQNLSFRH